MTWGQYCAPAGVASGFAVVVVGFYFIMQYNLANDAVAMALALVAFCVGVPIALLSRLDRQYVAKEKQEKAARIAEFKMQERISKLAREMYDEYLASAPAVDMIAFIRDRTTPARFIQAARAKLESDPIHVV